MNRNKGHNRIIERQNGSIMVSTLLVLLVMNLLAISLLQTSAKESKLATYKTVDSEVFHITDSCIQDSMKWIGDQGVPPDTLPYVITEQNLDFMMVGDETEGEINRLSGYSYSCTTTDITVLSVTGDSVGEGNEIGENSGYGSAGDLTPRYYYQVTSTGLGPQSSTSTIVATLSAEY